MTKDIIGQTEDVLASIDRLLGEAGSDKTKILSAQIFLPDMGDFAAMNSVWERWVVAGHTPARATIEAKLANPAYRIEILVVAPPDRGVAVSRAQFLILAPQRARAGRTLPRAPRGTRRTALLGVGPRRVRAGPPSRWASCWRAVANFAATPSSALARVRHQGVLHYTDRRLNWLVSLGGVAATRELRWAISRWPRARR
jgi:hypothetical protein